MGVVLQVLFVCTGNICRSPIAERLAAASLRGDQAPVVFSSAGTRALRGRAMHEHSIVVLGGLGGSAEGFCSRQLTAKIAGDADLILTMTRAHREQVLEQAPKVLLRTYTLGEVHFLLSSRKPDSLAELSALRPLMKSREAVEVPDPIGQDIAVFDEVGSLIADLLPPVVNFCDSVASNGGG